MKYTTVEARNQFSEIINRAAFGQERIRLTRRGKVICAVVPIEDVELLEWIEDVVDNKAIDEAEKEGLFKNTVSAEEFFRELDLERKNGRKKKIQGRA